MKQTAGYALLVLCLSAAAPGRADAQDQDAARTVFKPVAELVDEPIPASACTKCDPHVERIKDLQRLRRYAHDRLGFFQRQGVELSRTMGGEQEFVLGMGLVMEVGDLEKAVATYTAQIAQALADLAACNATCGASPPPGGTGTTGTPEPTGVAGTSGTTCPDCDRIIEDLQAAEARRARDAGALEHYRNEQQQKKDQRAANETALRNLRRNNQGDSAEARKLEDDIRFDDIEARGLGAAFDAAYIRELERRIKQADEEIARLKEKLEDCRKYCQPKKTSGVFRGPLPYAIGGGAVAVAALVGGGDNPTAIANTPVAPQPPVTTANPSPPPAPAPTRRPAAVLNITACVCVDNSAALDGALQTCQRSRQIRTQGSGNSLTLIGDGPLPTFQGTFNEATGEFELRATTTAGTASIPVTIAGTVETTGNLHNLRASFSGAGGRQTLYTLTTSPVQ